jgi:hypothetical protein
VIADCYAATQPDDRLWRRYLAEVARLEKSRRASVEDCYLLRHSLDARTALMEMTLGEERTFTEGTVPEILEHIKVQIRAGEVAELAAEREKRIQAEDAAEAARVRERTLAETTARAIRASARRYARWAIATVEWGGLPVLAAGAFPWTFPAPHHHPLRYAIAAAALVVWVLTVRSLWYGASLKECLRSLEVHLAAWFEIKLGQIVGPPQSHSEAGEAQDGAPPGG